MRSCGTQSSAATCGRESLGQVPSCTARTCRVRGRPPRRRRTDSSSPRVRSPERSAEAFAVHRRRRRGPRSCSARPWPVNRADLRLPFQVGQRRPRRGTRRSPSRRVRRRALRSCRIQCSNRSASCRARRSPRGCRSRSHRCGRGGGEGCNQHLRRGRRVTPSRLRRRSASPTRS